MLNIILIFGILAFTTVSAQVYDLDEHEMENSEILIEDPEMNAEINPSEVLEQQEEVYPYEDTQIVEPEHEEEIYLEENYE